MKNTETQSQASLPRMVSPLLKHKWQQRSRDESHCRDCDGTHHRQYWEDGVILDPLVDRGEIYSQCENCGSYGYAWDGSPNPKPEYAG